MTGSGTTADAELCRMAGGVLRFADNTPEIPADLIIWTAGKLRPHTAFLPRTCWMPRVLYPPMPI